MTSIICPQCATAADAATRLLGGHSPQICRDFALPLGGCPCQHKPIRTATAPSVISNGDRNGA